MYVTLDSTRAKYFTCEYYDSVTEEEFDKYEKLMEEFFSESMKVCEIKNLLRMNDFKITEGFVSPMFNPNFDKYPWLELNFTMEDSSKRRCYISFKIEDGLEVTI